MRHATPLCPLLPSRQQAEIACEKEEEEELSAYELQRRQTIAENKDKMQAIGL